MAHFFTPKLSSYQLGMIHSTASSEIPIFLLPRPTAVDSLRQQELLNFRYVEIKQLVQMGLMEEVSEEFKTDIADQIKRTGRRFEVYGLSEIGFLMFNDGVPDTVN